MKATTQMKKPQKGTEEAEGKSQKLSLHMSQRRISGEHALTPEVKNQNQDTPPREDQRRNKKLHREMMANT